MPLTNRYPVWTPDGNIVMSGLFPEMNRSRSQVSIPGGMKPVWAHSARELFYRTVDGTVGRASRVQCGGTASPPRSWARDIVTTRPSVFVDRSTLRRMG